MSAGVRRGLLVFLGLGGIGACGLQALVGVLALSPDAGGGDGLGMFFPVIAAALAIPLQLVAIAAWVAARARRRHEALREELGDDAPPRRGLTIAAAVCLGLPALVMAICTLVIALAHPGSGSVFWMLAEPGTLLWGPMWGLGAIIAGVAFGYEDRPLPLLLLPAYPLLGYVYMMS